MVFIWGFFTLLQLADALLLSKSTVKRLVRAGLISPRYQLLSGRSYRLVFEPAEVIRFIEENYPTSEDLAFTSKPRSRSADRIRRLRNMHLVSIGRVNAMQSAKESGLEGKELETQEKEPVIVDQKPRRQRNHQEGKGEAEDEWSPRESRDVKPASFCFRCMEKVEECKCSEGPEEG